MKTDQKAIDLEELLLEAEALIQEISQDVINEMEEEHRLQFEMHTQELKKIKSKVHGTTGDEKKSEAEPLSEGMHEAILDIIKSMQDMTKYGLGSGKSTPLA